MSDNKIQNVDLSVLNGLSPEERKLAIEMLKEIADTGKSELLEKMKYGDFEEIPVDIHTFLHDKRYLGNGLYDQDGRFTLFPYWEETLKKIFPDNITTAYNTLILTGSIGIGKSTCAVICQLYMLHRLLCLKDPYLYYGMQPIDKITISLMNITIENAKGVALDKLNQLILSSDWFMSHGEMHGTTNMIFVPDKHIEFVCASSNNQIIGRALFCLDGDTEIVTSDGVEKIKNLVDKPIKVISVDDAGQKILSDTCTVKPTIKTEEEYEIELEDGTVIKCTPNHRLRLKDGSYKEAQYLTENDELMDIQVTYNEFINNIIKTRGQWGIKKGEYKEVHHVIPKCMGGLPNNKTLSYAEKNSHHKNLIWLTAEEHYIAHKLLYLEHPDNYGLFAAWRHISRNGQLKKEDYDLLKNYNHKLPDQILNEIEKNGEFRYKKVQTYCKKTNRNTDKYKKEMQRRKACGIGNLSGAKNGMYKNGYKIANGNNGHASIRYFYLDKTFESRKELLEYLWSNNIKITSSAIRKIVHNTGTLRVYNMYKDVFDNLKWEFKDEN